MIGEETGGPASALAAAVRSAGVTAFVHRAEVASTMDEAHALAAAGAPAGTLVLADRQRLGRGRTGKAWHSEEGAGVWCTMIERPQDPAVFPVLSLRVGLLLAEALDPLAPSPLLLKWPNDLYTADGKVGGILTEARWRGERAEWVAIGVGVNRRVPSAPLEPAVRAAALRDEVPIERVLTVIVESVRRAAIRTGPLTPAECDAWGARDLACGRQIVAPMAGTVLGITADGGLRVADPLGVVHSVRSGSLQIG